MNVLLGLLIIYVALGYLKHLNILREITQKEKKEKKTRRRFQESAPFESWAEWTGSVQIIIRLGIVFHATPESTP